ncbi:5-formyltetrahydrofolate cyclo-ligase [Lactobacillus sp. DCY120]|uniref:5-formyltetrahydrofolate cyclo-ligase n=1 Tax=Bombilactobacillus apium TaxID=2675299 RepID=A0A850R4Y6_9LACO|nr:5-formyltetrahydrofolate cyclo-ligase [Bombilactobacillus apium]NVY97031.1 5-formyltetrahydrofolate cyclo-ligase [Bombilactobacillus apium]
MFTKEQVRQQQQQLLRQNPQTLKKAGQTLAQELLADSRWQEAQRIALTMSQTLEVDTRPLIQAAWQAGKEVFLPRVLPHRQLAFLPYTQQACLEKSRWGLWEPPLEIDQVTTQFDLIIVPGIAFVRDSHLRLGFGGGYYDRFLAQQTALTMALVPPILEFATATWPQEEFDICPQFLVTSRGIEG